MGGVPWVLVLLAFSAISLWRGWMKLAVVAVFCAGVGAADTTVGYTLYSLMTGLIGSIWSAIISAAQKVV